MSDERPIGFEDEPASVEPADVDLRAREAEVNGGIGVDPLDHIIASVDHGHIHVIAARLRDVERHLPDAIKVGQGMANLGGRLGELEKAVTYLSQQRAVQEIQMERQVRGAALDMAIKALPDAVKASPEAAVQITDLSGAFLAWLKAGAQA